MKPNICEEELEEETEHREQCYFFHYVFIIASVLFFL